MQTTTASLDTFGFRAGALNVPASATAGTTFVVPARCTAGVAIPQSQAPARFEVEPPLTGPTGPPGSQASPGPAGSQGPQKEPRARPAPPARRERPFRN